MTCLNKITDFSGVNSVIYHGGPELIPYVTHTLVVAPHAGDTVDDRRVPWVFWIADDVDRPFGDRISLRIVKKVGLESISQTEDGFATVVCEASGATRPDWELEQVPLSLISC